MLGRKVASASEVARVVRLAVKLEVAELALEQLFLDLEAGKLLLVFVALLLFLELKLGPERKVTQLALVLAAPARWRFLDALAPLLCRARDLAGESPREEFFLRDRLTWRRSAWTKGHLHRSEGVNGQYPKE